MCLVYDYESSVALIIDPSQLEERKDNKQCKWYFSFLEIKSSLKEFCRWVPRYLSLMQFVYFQWETWRDNQISVPGSVELWFWTKGPWLDQNSWNNFSLSLKLYREQKPFLLNNQCSIVSSVIIESSYRSINQILFDVNWSEHKLIWALYIAAQTSHVLEQRSS